MELTNEFGVGLPIDQAWALLTDVERIAPCMPGAQLTGVEGETYSGRVLIKLGPVTTQYAGTAVFERKDDAQHVAVLRASGRDTHGQGNASALITATLASEGTRTKVSVHTDLTITGKVAQFGRGVILDVSTKLLAQFVDCLESSLAAAATEAPVPEATASGGITVGAPPAQAASAAPGLAPPRQVTPREVAPLDLASVARGAVLKRLVPVLVVIAVVVVLIVWLG